jgi:hypothetical protein
MVLALSVSIAADAVVVQAQSVLGGDWSPAAGAMGDNTYEGFIDQPASGAAISPGASFPVSGWVVDTTAEGWSGIDGVQVMLGSTLLTTAIRTTPIQASAGSSRPHCRPGRRR